VRRTQREDRARDVVRLDPTALVTKDGGDPLGSLGGRTRVAELNGRLPADLAHVDLGEERIGRLTRRRVRDVLEVSEAPCRVTLEQRVMHVRHVLDQLVVVGAAGRDEAEVVDAVADGPLEAAADVGCNQLLDALGVAHAARSKRSLDDALCVTHSLLLAVPDVQNP
jgi:hypothetical protein